MSVKTSGLTITGWLMAVMLLLIPFESADALGTRAGTVIRNVATATFNNSAGIAIAPITSNVVSVVVTQIAAVDVSPPTAIEEVGPGSTAKQPVQVTNQGNGFDLYDLTKTDLPEGWVSVMYRDTNQNGVLDPSENDPGNIPTQTTTLDADSIYYLILCVTPAITAIDGDTTQITITGTSQFDNQVKDSGTYTIKVVSSVLEITKTATPINPKPLDVVAYTIRVTNTGSRPAFNTVVTDTIPQNMAYANETIRVATDDITSYDNADVLTDGNDNDTADFGFAAGIGGINVGLGELAVGEVRQVFFRSVVNEGVMAATLIDNEAFGTFEFPSGLAQLPKMAMATVTVDFKALIEITSSDGMGEPSDTVNHIITIRNKANESDILNLTGQSSEGFDFIIWVDTNRDSIPGNTGDAPLTDSNNDVRPDAGTMAQGDSLQLIVQVIIPAGTPDSTIDINSLTLSSATDPTVIVIGTATTLVKAPRMVPVKTATPPGSQPAGTELLYTIVITNNGMGTADSTRFTDTIPALTDYLVNSITLDGVAQTDGADGDDAVLDNSEIQIFLGRFNSGESKTVAFRVKIKETL
jgi:uncharacterized repeat protein (TIGR01451 family)